MQVYESSLGEHRRPCAPKDCVGCGGCRKLHSHESYQRYRHVVNSMRVTVRIFICPQCRLTVSVIPVGMFPYRSLPVARFEEIVDERTALAGGGARPPPASAVERGCIKRAAKRLLARIPLLCGLLGQMLPVLGNDDLDGFWRALRGIGRLEQILIHLARDFKTSLLACYRSLRAPWQRQAAPS